MKRTAAALVFAPLTAPVLVALLTATLAAPGDPFFPPPREVFYSATVYAYVVSILAGLPVFGLLKRFKKESAPAYSSAGFVVGLAFGYLVMPAFCLYRVDLIAGVVHGLVGAAVAMCFWLIKGAENRPNRVAGGN